MEKTIKQIDELSLDYKTFLDREPELNELEICRWQSDDSKYTIATFEYREEYNDYILVSVSERMLDIHPYWREFGELVQLGYDILHCYKETKRLREEYNVQV